MTVTPVDSYGHDVHMHRLMMTAEEFRTAMERLGWNYTEMGRVLRRSQRTMRRYAKGETPIPGSVQVALEVMLRERENGFAHEKSDQEGL